MRRLSYCRPSARLFARRVSSEVVNRERGDARSEIEPEDLGVEGELGLERSADRVRPPKAVAFALEEKVGVCDAVVLQSGDEELRLRDRHDVIFLSLEGGHRRADPVGEVDGAPRAGEVR